MKDVGAEALAIANNLANFLVSHGDCPPGLANVVNKWVQKFAHKLQHVRHSFFFLLLLVIPFDLKPCQDPKFYLKS